MLDNGAAAPLCAQMSSADYYAPVRSAAERELLERGRKRTAAQLAALGGRGAAAEWREELEHVERAASLDKFVVRAAGAQFTPTQRAALERHGECAYFAGGATAHVLVPQAVYDTRWLAIDFTREQRLLACVALLVGGLALAGALWLRVLRTGHSGPAAPGALWLFDEPLEWAVETPLPPPLADEL